MRTIVAILAILEKSKWILMVAIVAIMASLKKENKKQKTKIKQENNNN